MSAPSHAHISLPYRLLFLYFEPFAAFGGTYITLTSPSTYLLSLSPSANATTYSSLTYPIYAQLAGHLLLFSWLQAVLLRATASVKIWKIVLFGILLCDALHLYGNYVGLGAEVFWDPRQWRKEDWVTLVMTWGPAAMRAAFCLGVGVGEERKLKGS
ncbi:MAG: hypothetical protein Q9181_002244 [Wetmoreana brouardii]